MKKTEKSLQTADDSRPGGGRLFFQGKCSYEKMKFYFIADNDMTILHLTFSPKAHREAASRLKNLYPHSRTVRDACCTTHLCHLFELFISGRLQYIPYSLRSPFYEEATDFQKQVWKRISRIGYGRTKTYGELAGALGTVKLARAVGMACNQNPLALLIPCHRVVEKNGLGGFAGGAEVKSRLLAIERGETPGGMQKSRQGERARGRKGEKISSDGTD